MPDWKKIKAEYIRGEISYQELAVKYDVPYSTLRHKAKRENWYDMRTNARQKADAKLTEETAKETAKDEVKRVDKFNSLADTILAKIEENIANGTIEVSNGKGKLRDLTGAIKDLQDIKGIKSEADMKEQLARIKALEAKASADKAIEQAGGVLVLPAVSEGLQEPQESE